MKKRDIFLIAGIFAAAAILFVIFGFFKSGGDVVKIMSHGEEFASLPLDEDTEISVNGNNIVKIENGEAYVIYADCPDKLCMKQGKISDGQHVLVCLPNEMTVSIEEK